MQRAGDLVPGYLAGRERKLLVRAPIFERIDPTVTSHEDQASPLQLNRLQPVLGDLLDAGHRDEVAHSSRRPLNPDLELDRFPDSCPYALDGQPPQDFVEEPEDQQSLGLLPRETPAHQVEQLALLHLADGGTVRAADIVRLDLEVR